VVGEPSSVIVDLDAVMPDSSQPNDGPRHRPAGTSIAIDGAQVPSSRPWRTPPVAYVVVGGVASQLQGTGSACATPTSFRNQRRERDARRSAADLDARLWIGPQGRTA
jgi:hypothetical protein